MINLEVAKQALISPVPTIRTPYDRDGNIDYAALGNLIDFLIEAKAKSIVLTAGDSHYIAMSDKEIAEVTKAVTEQVNGRAMVVAAERNFDTKQAVEFAGYVKELGCDMLMLMPPDWAHSCTPETMSDHYAEVAKTIPVMIVTNVFVPRGIEFGLETIKLSLQKSNNIMSVKDDMCGVFARRLAAEFSEQTAVWAGGQKQNHMNMVPYGNCGYLSTFITFKPDIAWKYWNSAAEGNLTEATEIINKYDIPFFEVIQKNKGGFDAGIHGVMELFGICKRWRPKPYHTITDEELEILAHNLRKLEIL